MNAPASVVGTYRYEEPDDERTLASGTLRRLAGFAASALDARFAFVVWFGSRDAAPRRTAAAWLARDYGLRTDIREVAWPADFRDAPADVAQILRSAWPHERAFVSAARQVVGVPLVGADDRVVGCLGILDAESTARCSARAHLVSLARPAILELGRWVGTSGDPR
jgi:hypothetical protein